MNVHTARRRKAGLPFLLSISAALCALPAGAVQCPDGGAGADLIVTVENRTGDSVEVTVSGEIVAGSCTTGDSDYFDDTCEVDPGTDTCTITGLNTGLWTHEISYTVGTLDVAQNQQGFLVFDANDPTVIEWSYYPDAILVDSTGSNETCSVNAVTPGFGCTLPSAVSVANGVSGDDPVLIKMVTSGSAPANLTIQRDSVTIDGANDAGQPWVVADPGRAAAGSQSSFPTTISFGVEDGFVIDADDVRFNGVEIKQGVDPGVGKNQPIIEIDSDAVGFRLTNSRIDGQMAQTCEEIQNNCSHVGDGIYINPRITALSSGERSLTLDNVEIRSAVNAGVSADAHSVALIHNSWLHNNYKGNIYGNAPKEVSLVSSFVERASLRASDDLLVLDHPGIEIDRQGTFLPSTSLFEAVNSVIRNNANEGLKARSSATTVAPANVSFCGNALDGLYTLSGGSPSGAPVVTGGGGLGASYNGNDTATSDRRHGINVLPQTTTNYTLDDMSAFVSNTECGLFNRSETVEVSARFNQWEDYDPNDPNGPFDACQTEGGGDVDSSDGIDPTDTTDFNVFSTFPGESMLANQTIRILGEGFNAIEGNPASGGSGGCDAGIDGGGEWNGEGTPQPDSCCNSTDRSNLVDGEDDVVGNHVEVEDATESVVSLLVKSVTPQMIEAVLPSNVSCRGGDGEMVFVTKNDDLGEPVTRSTSYCIPTEPL